MLSPVPDGEYNPESLKVQPMSPAKAKTIFDFEALRKRLGFNQPEMAGEMHISPRTYFSLENKPSAISQRHIMLAQLVSLQQAIEQNDASLADPDIAEMAKAFSKIGKRSTRFV